MPEIKFKTGDKVRLTYGGGIAEVGSVVTITSFNNEQPQRYTCSYQGMTGFILKEEWES
jgi:uncharacterized protein YodC (DUF2158 family)